MNKLRKATNITKRDHVNNEVITRMVGTMYIENISKTVKYIENRG